jgi:pilus assembly protein CpaD
MSTLQAGVTKRHGIGLGICRVLAMTACAAALSGCYSRPPHEITASVADDYRQRHPITVREGIRTVQLFVGSRRAELTGGQRADVLAFANTWQRESAGGVVIEQPIGTPNAASAVHAVQQVRSILAAGGIPLQSVNVRPYRPADTHQLATVKLSYPAMVASAGPCGMWPRDLGATWDRSHNENTEYWNFGCAAQRNLAAMVENPADLVQPRGAGPTYSGRRTTVLDKYHRGESTQTVDPSADKGKISDLGK